MLPQSHPKNGFHVSGTRQMVSHPVAPRNLYVLGASLRLTPWLHSQKLENFYPAEDLAPVQTGGPKKKTWPLNGTLAFAKSRGRTQNFLTFCCLPVSCPPLSPSDFLDDPYSTFHIHMTSWKEFWGSLWSRSFPILKKPEGSKTNILKNPLLTKLISQVGRELSFPSSWPS